MMGRKQSLGWLLIIGIGVIWFVIGLLMTPLKKVYIWRNLRPENYAFLLFTLVLIVGLLFATKFKVVFEKIVAGLVLVFHSLPTLAYYLKPFTYVSWMAFPTGFFFILILPWNPLILFPPIKWLYYSYWQIPSETGRVLEVFGKGLFILGTEMFLVGIIQLLKRRGLVTSCLYSVVRHPQYLGLILATLGLTLMPLRTYRPMSLIAWLTLLFAYILMAKREEAHLQEKYGEKFQSYKRRVPFMLPLLKLGFIGAWWESKKKRYIFLLTIYITVVIATIVATYYSAKIQYSAPRW